MLPPADVAVNTELASAGPIAALLNDNVLPATPCIKPIKSSNGTRRLLALLGSVAERAAELEEAPLDGVGNNELHPRWGAAGGRLRRVAPAAYEDGAEVPRGGLSGRLPGARMLSNALGDEAGAGLVCGRGLTELATQLGQLLAHDLSHTVPLASATPAGFFPIDIPRGDPVFDLTSQGGKLLRFRRSAFDPSTGDSATQPRQQTNKITSYIDGSCIYGSDAGRLAALRTRSGGRLRASQGGASLPPNFGGAPNDNPLGRPTRELRLAGDARANIQPGLLALHTLWLREHNAVADAARLRLQHRPELSDEMLFQVARRVVVAELQAVTFTQYLPALLGADAIPPYAGYRPEVDASISTEFSTAAFRFGHSQVHDDLLLVMADGATPGALLLNESYFRARELLSSLEGGVDPLLRGMVGRPARAVDLRSADGVRNFLFGPAATGGLDLFAANIQRGRDHGLPDYNAVRAALGLTPAQSFEEVTSDPTLARRLAGLYGDIGELDLYVGGLCEDRLPASAVGPTFHAILVEQFTRLRDGDRFWYQRIFLPAEVAALESVTIGELLSRHVYLNDHADILTALQGNPFLTRDSQPLDRSLQGFVAAPPPLTSANDIRAKRAARRKLYAEGKTALDESSSRASRGDL